MSALSHAAVAALARDLSRCQQLLHPAAPAPVRATRRRLESALTHHRP